MKLKIGFAIGMAALAAWAQSDSEMTARQLFLISAPATPPRTTPNPPRKPVVPKPAAGGDTSTSAAPVVPVAQVEYPPLALKYSLLQLKGANYIEVSPDTEFHTGDHIKVRVEANTTAYLYIVHGGSGGQWQVLFPSKDIDGGNNLVAGRKACIIPSGEDSFYFNETAGIEKVSLVLSRAPQPDLEKLIYAAGDPSRTVNEHRTLIAQDRPIDNAVMGRLRDQVMASRDLVFDKGAGSAPDANAEKAFYAATKDKSENAELFVDMQLVHK